jgi:transcriptional regulator with XRE-family HTH domain
MGDVVELRAPSADPTDRSEAEPLWRELVGDTLRTARQESELRLVDVAERAGVSPQYLSEVERGLKDPSSEILSAVAGALELQVVELVTRAVGRRAAQAGARAGITGPMCLAA